ncbi:MAG TPA: MFS transporter [bacterium]|nr:MFS transporter [bacterium]
MSSTMDLVRAARRITATLFAAQSLASAAQVAIFPVAAIVGARLAGRASWAGVPPAVFMIGSALSAALWGRLMDRLGRRATLLLGLGAGTVGAAVAAAAIELASFGGFLVGSLLVGVAVSAVQLARFVAAEVHPEGERARAISTVVLGGTVGAVAGPLLAGASTRAASAAALEELAGPYVVTTLLFLLAGLIIFALLRPDPEVIGRAVPTGNPTEGASGPGRPIGAILRVPAALVAVAAMVFGQLIMAMLMVITPLHMRGHHHALSGISFVISVHVVGMYAFSILSGRLADRLGRGPVIAAGAAILILAGLAARLEPSLPSMSAALFLLGLGWNCCYVGGSTLLADQLSPAERGRTQGFNDLLVGMTSATGSLGSGIVFAAIGYGAMALVAAAVALIPFGLTVWWRTVSRAASLAQPAK